MDLLERKVLGKDAHASPFREMTKTGDTPKAEALGFLAKIPGILEGLLALEVLLLQLLELTELCLKVVLELLLFLSINRGIFFRIMKNRVRLLVLVLELVDFFVEVCP